MDEKTLSVVVDAVAECLAGWERPVVTSYELSALVCRESHAMGLTPELLSSLYKAVLKCIGSFRLVSPSKDFLPGTVFHLFGRTKPLPMEVACAVDPFAYVTHLSAMEVHGITDRFSKILYLTTPPSKEWKEQAKERMSKELAQNYEAHQAAKLPSLKWQLPERIEGMRVELLRRSSRGAFKTIASPSIRVATVGRTFLDMVREPDHCGGIQHVIDIYRESASRYLPLIVEEIERHGKSIEKVRAGFLLAEVCGFNHPRIEGWKIKAQRGGSRVLDPKGEYASFYSDTWKLSINVPSLQKNEFGEEWL
ncbi:hypothetical protein H9L41_14545 [Chitinimonas koreensis]|nr:hypothetical protein H9L41_14545 [Chitinimonas koreensis]